jgi:hypothetical protein
VAKDTDIPISVLRESLAIDAACPSGLRWKDHRPREHFIDDRAWKSWNAQWPGKPAGAPAKDYWRVRVTIGGRVRTLGAHRVVFALTHGRWPAGEVDHRNRDRAGNTPGNLREATTGQNRQNMAAFRSNKHGFKGVHWNKAQQRWLAIITVDGRARRLGGFVDIVDAIAARQHAERKLHPVRAAPRLDGFVAMPPDMPEYEAWKAELPRGVFKLPPRIHFLPWYPASGAPVFSQVSPADRAKVRSSVRPRLTPR